MQKTILAVDYDPRTLEEIQDILKGQDFTFLTARDGVEAATIFKTDNPDLVLTSALLPKLNGFELCKKISAGELGEARPVIMFSGIYKAEKYRKEAIIACGAVEFLDKPLSGGQLLRVVENLFKQVSGEKTESMTASGVSQPLMDLTETEPIEILSASALTSTPQQVLDGEDVLEVNEPAVVPIAAPSWQPEQMTGLKEYVGAPLLPPESKEEIDAALNAVLIEADQATRMRDLQRVRELESQMAQLGSNILEIEPALSSVSPLQTEGEVIELDLRGTSAEAEIRVVPPLQGPPPPAPTGQQIPEVPPGREAEVGETPSETSPVAVPSFAMAAPPSRRWIPFALLLFVLLVAAYFLFRSG